MRYVHPVRVYLLVFLFVAAISVNNAIRSWVHQPPFEAESMAFFRRRRHRRMMSQAAHQTASRRPVPRMTPDAPLAQAARLAARAPQGAQ